jgi:succinoglycan biosynthesis transport protein ExoP
VNRRDELVDRKVRYDHILLNIVPILLRRRRLIWFSVIAVSCVVFLFHSVVGNRYEAYTLLRVGQGIKDRSAGASAFGEGIDLAARMDSLARITVTDQVIWDAGSKVGFDRLTREGKPPLFSGLRSSVAELGELLKQFDFLSTVDMDSESSKGTGSSKELGDSRTVGILSTLRNLISAKQEGKSDLIRITFRYRDPGVAAAFLNELALALIGAQAELGQVQGADVFFQQQAKRLEEEVEKAGKEVQNFSVAASIYSVAEQRQLLLRRAYELGSLLATTRGSIADRKGQKQAIVDQLMVLKPVTQSKTVTGIVNSLGAREFKGGPTANLGGFEEAPPLLLVRVYQDAVASLLKVNSELSGSLNLEKMLGAEIEQVNGELAALASKEAEYDRLKRGLSRASAAAENYQTRVIEEQLSRDIAKKTQLSNVRVAQAATTPMEPIFPRVSHLLMIALFGGIALGAAAAVMLETAAMRGSQDPANRDEDECDYGADNTLRSHNDMRFQAAAE